MKGTHKIAPYSLRLDDQLKELARGEAFKHRRSLNAELNLLIEDGLKWREAQRGQAKA